MKTGKEPTRRMSSISKCTSDIG